MSKLTSPIKLDDLIQKIEDQELVLPDFQRNFVWTEDKMKSLFASVLCQMPIGSILVLDSDKNDFACKKIGAGAKTSPLTLTKGSICSYLLDGQQRITSLFAGFTTFYFTSYKNDFRAISSHDLLKMYFLKIPTYKNDSNDDIFNSKELSFNLVKRSKKNEYFSSSTVFDLIESKKVTEICDNVFLTDGRKSNEKKRFDILDTKCLEQIISFCISGKDEYYYIPIQFIESSHDEIQETYNKIVKAISILVSKDSNASDKQESWREQVKKYLSNCITILQLNCISVDNSNKARAIEIYSNLNIGGIKLDVFDLIMAKLGTVSNVNFYERLTTLINTTDVKYPIDVLPKTPISTDFDTLQNTPNFHNMTDYYQIINDKNEIERLYINVFLNTLGLYIANSKGKHFDPNVIKQDKLLELDPKEIDASINTIFKGMDRAILFFATRCGIRKIADINYKAEFAVIAFFFCYDDYFNNSKIHDFFEYWYWISIFAWLYPSNQNIKILGEIPEFKKLFDKGDKTILEKLAERQKNDVLTTKHYSDKDILTMITVSSTDEYPAAVMTKYICQFYLAYDNGYKDLQKNGTQLNGLYSPDESLDIHHINPLGAVKKLGQQTKELRNKKDNSFNSPLNMLYITKPANKMISDMSLSQYSQDKEIKDVITLIGCDYTSVVNGDIKDFLARRFDDLNAKLTKQLNYLHKRADQI